MDRAPTSRSDLDRVAEVVERLAVLLAAGIPSATAWRYLAEPGEAANDTHEVVFAVSRADAGLPIGEALLDSLNRQQEHSASTPGVKKRSQKLAHDPLSAAWRGLAAAWIVAADAGAPLAPALLNFARSLRALAQANRDASVALSGPTATAKLVLALPVVGVLFGMALGFDTLGTLVTTVPGLVCLVVGGTLLWAGRAWNRRLVHAATTTDLTPGLVLDLLAIAVSGGASLDRARSSVADATKRCCVTGTVDDANSVLSLARRAGVPAGALLQSEADRVRREAKSEADRKAAKLAVTLMIPLGLCVLPAFMLVGVAPLMIAVLSSTVSVF